MNVKTKVKSDIDIALAAELKPITKIAESIGMNEDDLELYGKYKAKLTYDYLNNLQTKEDGRLILVTSINPTKAGEGKSTVTVGLGGCIFSIRKKCNDCSS